MVAFTDVPSRSKRDVSFQETKNGCPNPAGKAAFPDQERAMAERKYQEPLRQAIMEVALALGGVIATHPIEDDVVRALAGSIGAITDRHLSDRSGKSRAMDLSSPNARLQPHPAIEKLLARIAAPPAPSPAAATEPASEGDRHDDEEWLRLPGLFRRWEFAEVIDAGDEYLVQQAGHDESGGSLFAIYSRPNAGKEEAP